MHDDSPRRHVTERRSRPIIGALALATSALAVVSAKPAVAQTTASEGDASAELFREGRQLLNEGRREAACEKFRASLDLRRSPGTLLNVGNCLDTEGDLVAALAAFDEVAELAAAEPDARKSAVWTAAANQERAALEPRIPRLTLEQPADVSVRVTIDGTPVAAFGEPLRLNPGQHLLGASAEGKQPFERALSLAEGEATVVAIPALEIAAPEPEVAAQPVSASVRSPSLAAGADSATSRVWPWALVGVGGALFVGGAVTGVVATHLHSEVEDGCPAMQCDNPDDLDTAERGETTALAADVLMLSGLVSAAVGTVWLLTLSDDSDTSLAAACSAGVCGAELRGRF